MKHTDVRRELIETSLKMNASGLNQGTSGNLSVRYDGGFLITPSGIPYDELSPDDLVQVGMDGAWRHSLAPSSEWRMHRDILAAKPEVNAVVHAHPPYCTTLAIRHMTIPAVHYMIAVSGGDTIPCAPYATFGTEELSRNAVAALADRTACLLANHGMIAIGPSLAKAVWLATEVETLARQYFNTLLIGGPNILPPDEIARVIGKFAGYGVRSKSGPRP
jgi:L-fuculose-phosphate aldolase